MAHVIFYEKPGCAGNARQQGLLIAAGHTLEVRDLLATPWQAATLRPFFGTLPVAEWFNPNAPAVRDGEIEPHSQDERSALDLLTRNPLLIRRPLLQVGDITRCGFDPAAIDQWIGLSRSGAALDQQAAERCPKLHTEPCSAAKTPR